MRCSTELGRDDAALRESGLAILHRLRDRDALIGTRLNAFAWTAARWLRRRGLPAPCYTRPLHPSGHGRRTAIRPRAALRRRVAAAACRPRARS